MSFWQGKCVVVTGASGFVGSAVVDRLRREEGVRIVRVARTLQAAPDSVPVALQDLARDVWQRCGVERVDVLLHLGGYIPKSPDAGMAVEMNYASNLIGTRRLLESLPNVPANIVFASSVDVYARTDDVIDERSRVDPASLYGASKLFLEKLLNLYASEKATKATALRLGHVYGPGEGEFKKIIPNLIRGLLDGRAPVLSGDGSVLRDYLYVSDAAEAFVRAAQYANDDGEPINVVSGHSVSMRALAEMLVELLDFPGEIGYRTELPTGVSLRFDNERFRRVLRAAPFVPLRQGLASEIAYFKELRDV